MIPGKCGLQEGYLGLPFVVRRRMAAALPAADCHAAAVV